LNLEIQHLIKSNVNDKTQVIFNLSAKEVLIPKIENLDSLFKYRDNGNIEEFKKMIAPAMTLKVMTKMVKKYS
jgi:hypothetical protein